MHQQFDRFESETRWLRLDECPSGAPLRYAGVSQLPVDERVPTRARKLAGAQWKSRSARLTRGQRTSIKTAPVSRCTPDLKSLSSLVRGSTCEDKLVLGESVGDGVEPEPELSQFLALSGLILRSIGLQTDLSLLIPENPDVGEVSGLSDVYSL